MRNRNHHRALPQCRPITPGPSSIPGSSQHARMGSVSTPARQPALSNVNHRAMKFHNIGNDNGSTIQKASRALSVSFQREAQAGILVPDTENRNSLKKEDSRRK